MGRIAPKVDRVEGMRVIALALTEFEITLDEFISSSSPPAYHARHRVWKKLAETYRTAAIARFTGHNPGTVGECVNGVRKLTVPPVHYERTKKFKELEHAMRLLWDRARPNRWYLASDLVDLIKEDCPSVKSQAIGQRLRDMRREGTVVARIIQQSFHEWKFLNG